MPHPAAGPAGTSMNETPHRHAELLGRLASQVGAGGELPVYLQLRRALTRAIHDGQLRPGDALPAVRAVAAALGLAPNTVAKTYALLQDDGLTENRAGAGTRVLAGNPAGPQDGLAELRRLVQGLRAAGISDEEVRATVEDGLAETTLMR